MIVKKFISIKLRGFFEILYGNGHGLLGSYG